MDRMDTIKAAKAFCPFSPFCPQVTALKTEVRAEFPAVRRWAEFSAVPKSGESGNGPKVRLVEYHL